MKDVLYSISSLFHSNKGKSFSNEEFYRSILKKKDSYLGKEKKHKKKYREKESTRIFRKKQEINELLEKLSEVGLVQISPKHITGQAPFIVDGSISIGKSGNAFISVGSGRDVFVWQENKKNARHRDIVRAEIVSYRRGRFEAVVNNVLQPFANKFFAVIVSAQKGHQLIRLMDMPDNEIGVLVEAQVKEGTYLLVESTGKHISLPNGKRGMNRYMQFSLVQEYTGNELYADLDRIAMRFSLPGEFAKSLIPSEKTIKTKEKQGFAQPNRKNEQKLYTITIDGDDAKDFDDAISIEKQGNLYIMYVHIADVSHYIDAGSDLEKEAIKRANSYYLTSKVIPMLPSIFSNEYCSLKPKTKRLAFTAQLHYTEQGELIKSFFYKSSIYINKRFTYSLAEKELDKKTSVLHEFWEFAQILIQKRKSKYRIDLNLPEVVPELDKKNNLVGLVQRKRLRSHRLIEEFMLSANEAVASFAVKNKIPFAHRNHEKMPEKNLDKLNLFMRLYGKKNRFKSTRAKEIVSAIETLKGEDNENIFHYLLLRSFSPAVYSIESQGHWGLAFKYYAHFTSPIRRIADLAVHRQLNAFLENKEYEYKPFQIEEICKEASAQERLAMEAERAMMKLLAVRLMQNRVGEVFSAWVSGMSLSSLYVTLKEPPLEGVVPAKFLNKKGELNPIDDFRVVAASLSSTIYMGMQLQVELVNASWENMQLEFDVHKIE